MLKAFWSNILLAKKSPTRNRILCFDGTPFAPRPSTYLKFREEEGLWKLPLRSIGEKVKKVIDYIRLISMKTSSGTRTCITRLISRSFASTSISRLWTRSSNLSQVDVPWPQGVFNVVRFIRLVGNGIGPDTLTPTLSEISFISRQISSSFGASMLVSRILAFCVNVQSLVSPAEWTP